MSDSKLLRQNAYGCPYLFLAPMEGVSDRGFRTSMATIGGFDEAVTEFMRVPANAHVKSLAKQYNSQELLPIPLAAQIMGSDPDLMAAMAEELERRGAPRIDLNCGCPSNTVTGRGAGSSLLKTPDVLFTIAQKIVRAVSIPVTIKMRIGYEDTTLFKENIQAAEASGVKFITLHPRTKVDGYSPPARWEFIKEAKSLASIPIVGNGDIRNVADAKRMLEVTGCDALMIGRGAVTNPFIFHEIKASFSQAIYHASWSQLEHFLDTFVAEIDPEMPEKNKINKAKQLMSFLFQKNSSLIEQRALVLGTQPQNFASFISFAKEKLALSFFDKESQS
jgi:nifR3 family TIM-barrel protein